MARAGWFALQPEAFKSIKKHEFESLVSDLLHDEWSLRGGEPDRECGPRGESIGDGKRDWGLTAGVKAPMSAAEFKKRVGEPPLIADTTKPVVFSAKTGKWMDLAKTDARRPAPKKVGRASAKTSAEKPSKKTADVENRQVQALAEGGRVCLVINVDAPDRAKSKAELARLFRAWPALQTTSASELVKRIEIIDANRLQRYLQSVAPLGRFAETWAERLGVELPDEFDSVEEWRDDEITRERRWPLWSDDERRNVLRDQLTSFLLGESGARGKLDRRRWVVGEPGIGKTRLVAEASLASDVMTRHSIRVTSDFASAKDWIDSGGFQQFPSLRLIVDDVDAEQASTLLQRFRKRAPERLDGALIVVTPTTQAGEEPEVTPTKLERLSSSSITKLIETAVPSLVAPMVSRIEALSKGVPWFAYLVARDVAPDTDPHRFDMDAALRTAVVGRNCDDQSFRRRVRLLMIVWLCDGESLPIETTDTDRLRRAVSLDTGWGDVLDAIVACQARGIVRRREDGRYYVSPGLLLREVVEWYFGPKGPPDGGKTIQRFAPREFERAMQTLPSLGVSADVVRSCAVAAVQPITSLTSLEQLSDAVEDFDALPFIAEHAAREWVDALLPVLRRGGTLSDRWSREANRVRWALQVAWGNGASFALVEECLFALAAVAGHESSAEELWSVSLFFALMWGDADAEWCAARLEMRARDRVASRRLLSIAGLRRMIDPSGTIWPKVPNRTSSISGSVAKPARRCVILLLELCGDEDASVRTVAVDVLVKSFVAAARLHAIAPNDDGVARWIALLDERQRAAVAFEVKRWFADASPPRTQWLGLLERRDIVGRVNDALFGRDIDSWNRSNDALNPLAKELLAATVEDWRRVRESLYAEGAAHEMSFAIALGYVDDERRCLSGLLADVDAGRSPDPLSAYLVGRRDAGDDIDAITRDWNAEPRLTARVVGIARMNPNDTQCAWLEDLARRGALSNHSLWALEWGRWENVSNERVLAFVDACLVDPTPKRFSVAARRLDRVVDVAPDDRAVLERCARVMLLAGEDDRWVRSNAYLDPIAKALLDAGGATSVAEPLAEMLVQDASGANSVAVDVMRACSERAPELLWAAVSRRFSELRRRVAVNVLLERAFGEWAPAKSVIDWVGADSLRARWVAEWCDVDARVLHSLTRALIEIHGDDADVTLHLLDRMTSGARRGSYVEALGAAIETLARWAREAPSLAAWCDRASSRLSAERSKQQSAQHRPTGT